MTYELFFQSASPLDYYYFIVPGFQASDKVPESREPGEYRYT